MEIFLYIHAPLTHHFFYYTEMNFNPMIQAVNAMGNPNTTFKEGSILSLRLEAEDTFIQGDGIIQFNFIFENGTAGRIAWVGVRRRKNDESMTL